MTRSARASVSSAEFRIAGVQLPPNPRTFNQNIPGLHEIDLLKMVIYTQYPHHKKPDRMYNVLNFQANRPVNNIEQLYYVFDLGIGDKFIPVCVVRQMVCFYFV